MTPDVRSLALTESQGNQRRTIQVAARLTVDGMPEYRRPPIGTAAFRDAEGRVIDYGSRWSGSPPEDTYSVTRHPQRFRPLHDVARVLVDWLETTYQVDRDDNPLPADNLARRRPRIIRTVRLTPAGDGAPLTVEFTSFPGVMIRAEDGRNHPYPVCGCDACDESCEDLADQMEVLVRSIAAGDYWEPIAVSDTAAATEGTSNAGATIAGYLRGMLEAAGSSPPPSIRCWPAWPLRE